MVAKKSLSSGLSCTEIVSIIEACANNGVGEISFGDLAVKFDFYKRARENTYIVQDPPTPYDVSDTEGSEADLVDAVLDSEDVLEQLKLTDPYEWERLTIEDEASNG
jgi:hypothetical protein